MTPATEWLRARLPGSPGKVTEEALALGITRSELSEACKALNVVVEEYRPPAGSPYERWVVGPAPVPPVRAPRAPKRADEIASSKPAAPDPKERVKHARARIQRHALRNARYLEELTEYAARDPEKCPTCKRGTPRAEAIRLQAILAALGIAGLTANPKGDPGEDSQGSPAIVFPPGTRIAVLAENPVSGEPAGVTRPLPEPALKATRADRVRGPLDETVGNP